MKMGLVVESDLTTVNVFSSDDQEFSEAIHAPAVEIKRASHLASASSLVAQRRRLTNLALLWQIWLKAAYKQHLTVRAS
jgi:hypothetical protein